jgi:helicase
MDRLKIIIEKMLQKLIDWGFITSSNDKDGFLSANEYGNTVYKTTPIGKRVSELYLDPYTANHLISCCARTKNKTLVPFSLLQMISHTLEMRPLLNARTADMEMIDEAMIEYDDNLIDLNPSMFDYEYQEYLASVKTALFLQNWIDECDEEFLLEKYNIRPGEIKVKLDLAEWLLYSTEELARIKAQHELITEIRKLRTRLKYGVKEELLPLLKLKGIGRVRARALFRNKIKDVKDIKSVDLGKLNQILGKALASKVKNQVGEKVTIIKENKRKGQISLSDF